MYDCIKCNKYNKYIIFILLTTFFRFFNACLLELNFNESFEKVSLIDFLLDKMGNKSEFDLSNYKMTEFFWNYVGVFIFSLISRA